jgi:hypothetical protein
VVGSIKTFRICLRAQIALALNQGKDYNKVSEGVGGYCNEFKSFFHLSMLVFPLIILCLSHN